MPGRQPPTGRRGGPAHEARLRGSQHAPAHGGAIKQLTFGDGSPATLEHYGVLISEYMRLALQRLVRSAANAETLPTSRWDEYLLAALS